jgi:hypothetical protein
VATPPQSPAALARELALVDAAFSFLAMAWVPWALSGLLIGAAVAIWLNFRWSRLEPVIAGLDEVIGAIEEHEGQASFRQRFPALFKRLAENRVIGEIWRAYAPTLTVPAGSEDAVGYTRRPEDSFNDTMLAVAGINLRFYHAVPNMLVGAGLLFTFIGLIAALYFASAGVAAADVKTAQTALRELLAAATFKFATSIAGLGSSLVFSWREKHHLHRVIRRIAHLCSALEARMVPVTGESLAAAQLAELKQQNAQLRRLTRDLFVRLPEGVEEGIAAEIGRAMAPLREAFVRAAPQISRLAVPIAERVASELAQRRPPGAAAPPEAVASLPPSPAPTTPAEGGARPEGATPDQLVRLAGTLRRRLDEAFGALKVSLDQLWGMRREAGAAERVKRVERLLHEGREQLLAAQAAAQQIEQALAARAAAALPGAVPTPSAASDAALAALLQRVDTSVDGAARQLAEAAAELQRGRGR